MSERYILDGKIPKECPNLFKWAEWLRDHDCQVALTAQGDARVSTAFLGLDYRDGPGEPLLFETMVFGGERAGARDRYSTWEQAEAGHVAMCAKVLGEGEAHGGD